MGGSGVFAFAQTLAGPQAAGKWVGLQTAISNFAGVIAPALTGFLLGYAIPPRPDDLLSHLTDAYSWHFLDLLPGVGVNGALGWQCPVDLEGGRRGAPEANSLRECTGR